MNERMDDERLEINAPTEEAVYSTKERYARPIYKTPQPDIPRGTRFRLIPKNFRNQLCGCDSGLKFKKCCIEKVGSKHLYRVPSAEKNLPVQ